MPIISRKGSRMPESPIRRLVPYAEKAMQEGKHIYHLNIGQPDIKTPQIALDAVRNHNLEVVEYSHSAGHESLRDKLVLYYQKHVIIAEREDIIVTTGGSEALAFTLNSITDPGDEIIVPEPFYANYYSFSTQSTVTVVPVISTIESGFALPPIADFEKLISYKTKAILICNPGNPTGYLYSKEEMQQLADIALKYDLFLISDEVYREYIYDDDSEHYSILQDDRLKEHAIMVDSVSKRYSMCGARIGCMVSRNKDVIKTAMKFAQARLSPPSFAQIAAEAALDVPEEFYKTTVAEFKSRRDTLVTGLQEIPGIKVATPRGAFYCIVELPVTDVDHFSKWLLSEFDVDGETVMVAPATGFYSSLNEGRNQVRIAYVLNKGDLQKATNILKLAMKAYPNRISSESSTVEVGS